MKLAYGRLLNAFGRVVGQAKRFSNEITTGVKCSLVPARQAVLEGHRQLLDEMLLGFSRSYGSRGHASFTVTATARAGLSACSGPRLR